MGGEKPLSSIFQLTMPERDRLLRTILALGVGGLVFWLAFRAKKALAVEEKPKKKEEIAPPKVITIPEQRIPVERGITFTKDIDGRIDINIPWGQIFGRKNKQPETLTKYQLLNLLSK